MHLAIIVLHTLYQLLISQSDIKSVKLERTVCYGRCPSYSVEIYSDGKVIYEGYEFVSVRGKHVYSIPRDSVKFLFRFVQQVNFFSLNDEYVTVKHVRTKPDGTTDTLITMVTDLPTQYVTVKLGNGSKRVKDYYGGPPELRDLEVIIDRIAKTAKFVSGKK
jgi:hypothetical protein